jgi:PfaD family protein
LSSSPRPSGHPRPAAAPRGAWSGGELRPADGPAVAEALRRVNEAVTLVDGPEGPALAEGGEAVLGRTPGAGESALLGHAAPLPPQALGDPAFLEAHGLEFPCVAGAMANGIASTELVAAMAKAGMLGIFGAAGLPRDQVSAAIDRLERDAPGLPWGVNLIHSPAESALEESVAELLLERRVRCVEASAFLGLTPSIVRYRVSGLRERADGSVEAPNRVIAKVSRVEVATKFLSPAPEKILHSLVESGAITEDEARLAARVPVAGDITAEADSGGHTDNRPALALLPSLLALRDRLQAEHAYAETPRVGLAGGISTPSSAAAAFAMGAAWIVTGSVNQACVESGSSDLVRGMLADARQADCVMAPAADMFEMGVKLQVLKRGTLFPMRAQKLYELYKAHGSLEEIPAKDRATLEKTIFRESLEEAWARTKRFWTERDPRQVERAEADPKHRMALTFRAYLGLSSRWANSGVEDRKVDFQIWCGPAMGAFNEWTRGSELEAPAARRVADVALNLLHGAAVLTRARSLRAQGCVLPPEAERVSPLSASRIHEYLGSPSGQVHPS